MTERLGEISTLTDKSPSSLWIVSCFIVDHAMCRLPLRSNCNGSIRCSPYGDWREINAESDENSDGRKRSQFNQSRYVKDLRGNDFLRDVHDCTDLFVFHQKASLETNSSHGMNAIVTWSKNNDQSDYTHHKGNCESNW